MVNPFFIQDVTMLTQYLSLWRKSTPDSDEEENLANDLFAIYSK